MNLIGLHISQCNIDRSWLIHDCRYLGGFSRQSTYVRLASCRADSGVF